jgi:hypothetical protein
MRAHWDIIPGFGTNKAVVKKWEWDRIALKIEIGNKRNATTAFKAIHEALRGLLATGQMRATGKYARTLTVFDPGGRTNHTPVSAMALLEQAMPPDDKKWTDETVCVLGGALIICAEEYKGEIEGRAVSAELAPRRMERNTDADLSRLSFKIGQLLLGKVKSPADILDFLKTVATMMSPWDRHGAITYRGDTYYAPTTMHGASATMMKVMKMCEALELDKTQTTYAGYAVALHWIDKYLTDKTWFGGGTFVPDRHSLIEALQGMSAYLEKEGPNRAAVKLAEMYVAAAAKRP